jgi:FAD/FMN-containing dehydrogenase
MSVIQDLGKEIQGQVLSDQETLTAKSGDFGRMIFRTPRLVVRPANAEDVSRVLKYAARSGLHVSTRGEAHTQTGQSLVQDGILLDMTSLQSPLEIDAKGMTATVGAGVKWRTLVERVYPMGLIPPVLTNNLDVTIGGTHSMAGLGVASFHNGAQVDNALELQVVLGTGEIVECSPQKNREVFDAVRSSLGQFGVITRAKTKLRPVKPRVVTYFLLYDDLGACMRDSLTLMSENRVTYLESWCVPLPMGFRKVGDVRRTFGEWFFPLHATIELGADEAAPEAKILAGLKPYRNVHKEDWATNDFAARLDPLFVLWRRSGYWANTHPWMETILPWDAAESYINTVLSQYPPAALGGGHVLLWPSRGTTSSTPLFMRPQSDWVMGFGFLPGLPKDVLGDIVPKLNEASDLSMMMGAKRYLSGIIQFDKERWRAHYGDQWATVCALKKKLDPKGVLNPGFVEYD